MEREKKIRKRFPAETSTIVTVWECDIKTQLLGNKEMKQFFDDMEDTTPFTPKDTLLGG